MNIPFDTGSIVSSVIVAGVLFLGSTILKAVRSVDNLSRTVERLTNNEKEYKALRDWAIKQGFDRRDLGEP